MEGNAAIELVMALPRPKRQLVRKRGHSCHCQELTETLWLFPFSPLWMGHSCQHPPDIFGLVMAIAKAKLLFQVEMHPVEGRGRCSWHMLGNGNWLLIQTQGEVFGDWSFDLNCQKKNLQLLGDCRNSVNDCKECLCLARVFCSRCRLKIRRDLWHINGNCQFYCLHQFSFSKLSHTHTN